ncbi:MAG: hypothetical protein QOK72_09025 [Nitrososphaeraceae archaeon]|nr:hypothetical protein [Nitrososphaeraceae archaeon]
MVDIREFFSYYSILHANTFVLQDGGNLDVVDSCSPPTLAYSNDNGNTNSDISDTDSEISDDSIDTRERIYELGADEMAEADPSSIPNNHLIDYINDTQDILDNPETAGIERGDESYEIWKDRNEALKEELEKRVRDKDIPAEIANGVNDGIDNEFYEETDNSDSENNNSDNDSENNR